MPSVRGKGTRENGQAFHKMTGSGNDFVFFDVRRAARALAALENPETIRAISARGTGVGADGVVFLVPSSVADVGIRYYNADGSTARFCGNATLCTIRLAGVLGIHGKGAPDLRIETQAGVMPGRLSANGDPEFDLGLAEVAETASAVVLAAGELAIAAATAGNPHFVVRVADLKSVDVIARGRELRQHPLAGSAGVNVNFVGALRGSADWGIRTYERGVEGETLACGSGTVATAAALVHWGLVDAGRPIRLWTRSGRPLAVQLTAVEGRSDRWAASLGGEGRLVYRGELAAP